MKDPFFQNEVTYTGEITIDSEVFPVSKVLTSDGVLCTIVLDTVVPPDNNPVTGTLTGEISPDGTMCDFAGTKFDVTFPIAAMIDILSGKATLSGNGQLLSLTDFVIIFPPPDELPIPDLLDCNCESVAPVM